MIKCCKFGLVKQISKQNNYSFETGRRLFANTTITLDGYLMNTHSRKTVKICNGEIKYGLSHF